MTMTIQSLAAIVLIAAATDIHNRPSPLFVAAQNGRPNSDRGGTARAAAVTCPAAPTLRCKNGSECEEGIANFGRQHDHLALQTHESGYFCKCLAGFIGHECGIQVDDCDGDTGYDPSDPKGTLTSCYHGSECLAAGGSSSSDAGFYCDCAKLNRDTEPTAKKYAGMLCQHESTSLCAASLAGDHAPNQQFCTNHGKCVKMVTGGDPHPGCVCRDGYAGERCEVRVDLMAPFVNHDPPQGTSSILGKMLFGAFIIAIVGTLIGIAVISLKIHKEGVAAARDARSATKSAGGAAALDPDGSGTLGTPRIQMMRQNLELSAKEGAPAPGETMEGTSTAPEDTLTEEEPASRDLDEPEIV